MKLGHVEAGVKEALQVFERHPDTFEAVDIVMTAAPTREHKNALMRVIQNHDWGQEELKQKISETLAPSDHPLINENPLTLCVRAEELYAQHDIRASYQITSGLVEQDAFDHRVIPVHTANLVALNKPIALYRLAHSWARADPESYLSWYMVATYYLLIKDYHQARKYFSYTTTLNVCFVPAWLGFGHSFAEDGEVEQAITAYNTASRLFPSHYAPVMWCGTQYAKNGQFDIAKERLMAAYQHCRTDPVLLNELGAVSLQLGQYKNANHFLGEAWQMSQTYHDVKLRATILLHLGHVSRRQNNLDQAHKFYEQAVALDPHSAMCRSCLGWVCHAKGDVDGAIQFYHDALSLDPMDSITSALLDRAMDDYLSPTNKEVFGGEEMMVDMDETPIARRVTRRTGSVVL
jgi:anaphase-promoting complex subunit 6